MLGLKLWPTTHIQSLPLSLLYCSFLRNSKFHDNPLTIWIPSPSSSTPPVCPGEMDWIYSFWHPVGVPKDEPRWNKTREASRETCCFTHPFSKNGPDNLGIVSYLQFQPPQNEWSGLFREIHVRNYGMLGENTYDDSLSDPFRVIDTPHVLKFQPHAGATITAYRWKVPTCSRRFRSDQSDQIQSG